MYIKFPQGDQKPITFKVKNRLTKNYLTSEEISEIDEITMTCRLVAKTSSPILFQKKLSDGTISFDETKSKFVISMLEQDTRKLEYKKYGFDIEFRIGNLIDTKVGIIEITDEFTKEE